MTAMLLVVTIKDISTQMHWNNVEGYHVLIFQRTYYWQNILKQISLSEYLNIGQKTSMKMLSSHRNGLYFEKIKK